MKCDENSSRDLIIDFSFLIDTDGTFYRGLTHQLSIKNALNAFSK
jgi:hypothetical protein